MLSFLAQTSILAGYLLTVCAVTLALLYLYRNSIRHLILVYSVFIFILFYSAPSLLIILPSLRFLR